MTTTLVTFLGKGRDNRKTGYCQAIYRFPDGGQDTRAFFGLALADHLRVEECVILGTGASQWGVLVENLAEEGRDEDIRIKLMDAEASGTVDQAMLDEVAPLMTKAIGREVMPRLIPFGRDECEQVEILRVIADAVASERIHVDVTHGFRHLGAIGFLSGFVLQGLRDSLDVRGIWYGALDMREGGVAPVLRLDGLGRARRWVDALGRYDATGDYGVFSQLLIEDGVAQDKARCLKDAAYHERTMNLPDAARKLRTFLPTLDQPLDGASGLFQKRLKERLGWAREAELAQHQRKLAREHLRREDYMRAAIFGWEAMLSLECQNREVDPKGYNEKKLVLDELRSSDGFSREHRILNAIRNALAHGTPPEQEKYKQILRNPESLRAELEKAFKKLLDGIGGQRT